ncbi:MAG: DUF4350 domain-containing protein [Phycisphaerae bacterium]|nr:DUF4350 domain-containing protein [Gemmatimonadaceae bacterium]
MLSVLAVLVLLTVLFTKTTVTGRNGDPRLSTTSTDPLGAKLFYELAGRMGYDVRRDSTQTAPRDVNTILAVLDPTVSLEDVEVHGLLEHARLGGALLLVLNDRTGLLNDSLKLSIDRDGGFVRADIPGVKRCGAGMSFTQNGMWFGPPRLLSFEGIDSLPTPRQTFVSVAGNDATGRGLERLPSVVGAPLGRGRIVVAADPDVLRNDALRNCNYGLDLPMVRALDYLSDRDGVNRRKLVFDEFHLGSRARFTARGIVTQYLTRTQSGNAILQVCVAGLIFLLAAATRVLPPRHDARVERRSPLEHVDALARAYAQVGATRTGALRLVRGLQRRVGGVRRASTRVNDDAYLLRIAESIPAVKPDVTIVRHALANAVSQREFVDVGNAIVRIEAALTKT